MTSTGFRTAPPERSLVAWVVAIAMMIAGVFALAPAAQANHDETYRLSVSDVTVTECDGAGTTPATFVVTLHRATTDTGTVTVDYDTANGTATAGSDYQPDTGNVLIFNPNPVPGTETDTQSVTINVICDDAIEPTETFTLNLSNASGATITDFSGLGTIVNDDFPPAPDPAPTTPAPTGTGTPAPTGSATPAPTGSATPAPTGTGTPAPTGTGTPPPGQANCTVGVPGSVTLTVNVPGRRITAGNAPTLSGTVFNTSNQPCASTAVTIFHKTRTTGWVALANVSTDPNGRFQLSVRPFVQTSYGANTANNTVRSNIVNLLVHTRVNIITPAVPNPITSARPVVNPVTFTGTLLPAYGGALVGLGRIGSDGIFRVLASTRTNSTGGYSLTRTLPRGTAQYVIFVSSLSQGNERGAKSLLLSVS